MLKIKGVVNSEQVKDVDLSLEYVGDGTVSLVAEQGSLKKYLLDMCFEGSTVKIRKVPSANGVGFEVDYIGKVVID